MIGTLFQPLLQLYKLKYPNRKSLSLKIIPKAEILATTFYQYIFSDLLKTEQPKCCLSNRAPSQQTVRQAYTNMFYSLGTKNQNALDFIACLICLLSQSIFSVQQAHKNIKIQNFIENLQKDQIKLRQHLYIIYTYETIGYKIGKQSAVVLFNHYIITQIHFHSNLDQKIRLNLQLKQIKANIQKAAGTDDIRLRVKKRTKNIGQNVINYKEEIKDIMRTNKIQIEEQSKKNKKFQLFIKKCVTQGQKQLGSVLSKKSPSMIKLSSFLHAVRNCNSLSNNTNRNSQDKQNCKSFEHWQKIVDKMKNQAYLTQKQVIPALSLSHLDYSRQSQNLSHIPNNSNFIHRKSSKANLVPQRSMHAKKTLMKYDNMLPDLKDYNSGCRRIFIQAYKDEHPVKMIYHNSRKLKRQLSEFIQRSKDRMIQL